MLLFIAEKPAMGKTIAKMLPGPHKNMDGYVETGGGYVSWCVGHLLEQAEPGEYDKKWEAFPGRFEDLPIIPDAWKLKPADGKSKQVNVIKGLLKQCSGVVNAGDPGREGQLIIDELLTYLGNKKPVQRILLQALDDATIKRALANLQDNRTFYPLYQAGLGRQRADWIVGMSMSRAYTILGQKNGYRGVLSVGRVQSPTLAIIVRRDREIENFVSKDYFVVSGSFDVGGAKFETRWKHPPSDDSNASWMDESGRIIDKTKADEIVARCSGKQGAVTLFEDKDAEESQPLPFNLSGLQGFASGKWGYTAQQVLDICQSLYDKKLQSYPRTDCVYLPESQLADGASIARAVERSFPEFSSLVSGADFSIKSHAWNDSKLGEHHGIIPTQADASAVSLTAEETNIHRAVCQRYLSQFYDVCRVKKARVEIEVSGETFSASGRVVVSPGWRVVFGAETHEAEDETKDSEGLDENQALPPMNIGDSASALRISHVAKKTKPPARFTDGTLLKAMVSVHQLVDDPALKQKLKDTKGIGQEATRAAIIETLVRRGFIERQKKQLVSSQIGRALVDALPPKMVDPAVTALWENALEAVATGRITLDVFMGKQVDWVQKLMTDAKDSVIHNLPSAPPPKPYSGAGGKSAAKASTGKASSSKTNSGGSAPTCPKCKKGKMYERVAKNGPNAGNKFLGCSNYPECKHVENPKK